MGLTYQVLIRLPSANTYEALAGDLLVEVSQGTMLQDCLSSWEEGQGSSEQDSVDQVLAYKCQLGSIFQEDM